MHPNRRELVGILGGAYLAGKASLRTADAADQPPPPSFSYIKEECDTFFRELGKYLKSRDGNSRPDIRHMVESTLYARAADSAQAMAYLRSALEAHKGYFSDPLAKDMPTEGLMQAIDPRGVIGGADYSALPYNNPHVQIEMAKLMLDYGADAIYKLSSKVPGNLGSGGEDNYTLLHAAAQDCSLDIVKLLIAHGADPKAIATYYHYPTKMSDGKPVQDETAAPVPGSQESVVDSAALGGKPETVRYLGITYGIKPMENRARPSLIRAALAGNVEMIRSLLTIGAKVDVKDNTGHTAEDYLKPNGVQLPQAVWDLWDTGKIRKRPEGTTYEFDPIFKYKDDVAFRRSDDVRKILDLLHNPEKAKLQPPEQVRARVF